MSFMEGCCAEIAFAYQVLNLGKLIALVISVVHQVSPLHCPENDSLPLLHEWYQPGDFIIGEITSQFIVQLHSLDFDRPPSLQLPDSPDMMIKFYQHILALVFAIQEINENPHISPNATLGFHIYDTYHTPKMTYRSIMDLLFKSWKAVPNYICGRKENLIAIIGGVDGDSSFCMADILGLYKVPQLTYGSLALEEKDTTEFYCMSPNEAHQYPAIISLLLHFGWTWVGLLIVDDDSGENFLKTLEPLLSRNGICLASIGRVEKQNRWDYIKDLYGLFSNIYPALTDVKANTILFYGQPGTLAIMNAVIFFGHYVQNSDALMERVWIMTGQADITLSGLTRGMSCDLYQGALSFTIHSPEVLGFNKFLDTIKPIWTEGNGFLKDFWVQAFNCLFQNFQEPELSSGSCTGEERLETIPGVLFEMHMTGHSYSIYNAVYAVIHALHAISTPRHNSRATVDGKSIEPQELQPWQLHRFLRDISFNNSIGDRVSFDKNQKMEGGFDIVQLIVFPNKSLQRVKVGKVDPDALEGKQFIIYEDLIDWQRTFNQVLPRSLCNDYCYPGFHKQKKEQEPFCCYDCAPCPEGEFSDRKDMDDCIRCPEDQFPSKDQDQCINKIITFLSCDEPLGITSAVLSVSLSLTAALLLGIFVKQRDTPIVKANNRDITYILLVSLLLCFLCPFLFLGEPSKLTCLFRQVVFTLLFTVAVSSILAKTITVVGAFMVTKPGSSRRKWLGKRLTNFILHSSSFIQAAICIVWLTTSPPFPDFDRKTLTREIVAECSEGSVVMFSTALGYLGLLSVTCLIVAFLARKLPDSFNEAKFISFSMLIFCSVWLCFVPTYLSTKGKYTVAVEIFSILASAAGLLGCIFLPKCYIIVLRPELNKKQLLISRRN